MRSNGKLTGCSHPHHCSKGGGRAGGGTGSGGRRTAVGLQEMQRLVPENAGNSRIYAAVRGLTDGSLKTQEGLQGFDIDNYMQHLSALNSKSIRAIAENNTITVPVQSGTTSVSRAAYRQFAAQANRDARRIFNAANSETLDFWARETRGSAPTRSRNPAINRLGRELNSRYERIQEQEIAARRAARKARQSQGG